MKWNNPTRIMFSDKSLFGCCGAHHGSDWGEGWLAAEQLDMMIIIICIVSIAMSPKCNFIQWDTTAGPVLPHPARIRPSIQMPSISPNAIIVWRVCPLSSPQSGLRLVASNSHSSHIHKLACQGEDRYFAII